MSDGPWRLVIAAPVRRQLGRLPESAGAAVIELMAGDLINRPRRVTKPLRNELDGKHVARRGEYRVIVTLNEPEQTVSVLAVLHRRDAYRP